MGQSHFKEIEYKNNDGIFEYYHIPGKLNPICKLSSTIDYRFEFTHDMEIKLLKPFFDSKMAFVVYDHFVTGGIFGKDVDRRVKCSYTYEGLKYITKKLPSTQISIIIHGDNEIIDKAKKIVDLSRNKTKQGLINYMTKILEQSEAPPAYNTFAPSAPAKEI